MLDRHECFFVFHHLHEDKRRKQRDSLELGKKRRESSKRNYYIISPRVITKAIIISACLETRWLGQKRGFYMLGYYCTLLLTSTLATLTPLPRIPNDIDPRVFPYKSLDMRPIPFFTALIPLHSPNLQSIALCSTFDDSIFGHKQPTQTPGPKK